jgi:hypothetical protein
MNHTNQMILIMMLSGLLSSMSFWADKLSDARLSINDLYMILLMTAWMVFFMSILHRDYTVVAISSIIIIATYYAIRKQLFVSRVQFYTGMIPHHSMALLMGKRVLERPDLTAQDKWFIGNIVKTQEAEIKQMNMFLRGENISDWQETTKL